MVRKSISRLLKEKEQLLAIGAHDGLSGRLGERAGFDVLWASGFEISASNGVPDANILDMGVQLAAACQINDAVSIPVIADCDNGYGNAVNAAYTARKFHRGGIAGICIEDNIFPKRCSFYAGTRRELVSGKEHALKVKAAKEAGEGELYVIARTEALIAGYSMEDALDRAEAYADAGADAILIHSKEKTPDQIIEFSKRWTRKTPLVTVPTTYDTITAAELAKLGCRIVIFANHGLRASIRAVEQAYAKLIVAGRASVLKEQIVSLQDVFDLVGVDELKESERKYLPSAE
ncbi:MAG TPA: isocitrate lyase/phosphoenolpyruvate mutase family protein [Tepidisphaeraceae bacterium]|nr:isocitrate lyase/phosphoenolpyruvate mutase family protein [Tepidisphaeraceae bacterium]